MTSWKTNFLITAMRTSGLSRNNPVQPSSDQNLQFCSSEHKKEYRKIFSIKARIFVAWYMTVLALFKEKAGMRGAVRVNK
jgi:hypothetical protein